MYQVSNQTATRIRSDIIALVASIDIIRTKSMGHNSVENNLAGPKFKLNLSILVTHLYTEFQFKT